MRILEFGPGVFHDFVDLYFGRNEQRCTVGPEFGITGVRKTCFTKEFVDGIWNEIA